MSENDILTKLKSGEKLSVHFAIMVIMSPLVQQQTRRIILYVQIKIVMVIIAGNLLLILIKIIAKNNLEVYI